MLSAGILVQAENLRLDQLGREPLGSRPNTLFANNPFLDPVTQRSWARASSAGRRRPRAGCLPACLRPRRRPGARRHRHRPTTPTSRRHRTSGTTWTGSPPTTRPVVPHDRRPEAVECETGSPDRWANWIGTSTITTAQRADGHQPEQHRQRQVPRVARRGE